MADRLVFTTAEIRTDRERSEKNRAARILKIIIVALVVFLVGEIVFHLVIAPRLEITVVRLDADFGIDRATALALTDLDTNPSYFSVDVDRVRSALEAMPQVKSATVARVFPDTVEIAVVGRRALALAFAETSTGTLPVVLDEEGVLYDAGAPVASLDLPVISGLRFPGYRPGARVDRRLTAFLEDLEKLRMDSPTLFRLVSEYRVVPRGDHDFEVVLYPVMPRIPVRIGNSIDEELLRTVVLVLDVVRDEAPVELDFRSGRVVYRSEGM